MNFPGFAKTLCSNDAVDLLGKQKSFHLGIYNN